MNRIRIAFLLMLVLPVWPAPSAAADRDGREPVRMDEVVVTASPITEGNRVNRLGSQVTSVTEDQIGDLNAQDFQSAVRMVPGVIISRQNPVGSFGGGDGGAIYIRGMGSARPGGEIQMAVDGIPKVVGVWSPPPHGHHEHRPGPTDRYLQGGSAGPFRQRRLRGRERDHETADGRGVLHKRPGGLRFLLHLHPGGSSTAAKSGTPIITFSRASVRPAATGTTPAASCRNTSPGSVISSMGLDMSLTANATNNFAEDPGPEGNPAARQGTYRSNDEMTVITLAHQYSSARGDAEALLEPGHGRLAGPARSGGFLLRYHDGLGQLRRPAAGDRHPLEKRRDSRRHRSGFHRRQGRSSTGMPPGRTARSPGDLPHPVALCGPESPLRGEERLVCDPLGRGSVISPTATSIRSGAPRRGSSWATDHGIPRLLREGRQLPRRIRRDAIQSLLGREYEVEEPGRGDGGSLRGGPEPHHRQEVPRRPHLLHR